MALVFVATSNTAAAAPGFGPKEVGEVMARIQATNDVFASDAYTQACLAAANVGIEDAYQALLVFAKAGELFKSRMEMHQSAADKGLEGEALVRHNRQYLSKHMLADAKEVTQRLQPAIEYCESVNLQIYDMEGIEYDPIEDLLYQRQQVPNTSN
ncbi:hypothetical protein [Ferrimonas marina]|uniref:Uncharacterized protein n=1 Tax=Ferrimonas marina TaxID=299255 RepID=A0A1M5TEC0_9GAMM|nr:hypothetical protein [Ferrimonas marina]SHH49064.1 hypothetical protein SAMN02745129_2107 [Ferrimonas marina]